MDARSFLKGTLCALAATFWAVACGDDTSGPATDAAADGASDGTVQDAKATQDVRREATATPADAMPAIPGNDGGCTPVAATCDGPEDCPSGQTCCGTLDVAAGGYSKIACQPSPCAPLADAGAGDGGLGGMALVLELCRADTMCHDTMGYTCGTSMFLPPFLYRCYSTMTMPPPATATGVPGHVACGTGTCNTGEQCCILGQTGMSAQTYCAPMGQACSCSGAPADAGSDAGGEAAAGDAASDAPSADTGADAPAEGAADAGGDAADAGGDAASDAPAADAHD
jgi:hypothetical protein